MKNQRILALVFVLALATSFTTNVFAKGGGVSADAKFAYSLRTEKGTDKIVLSFDNLSKRKVNIKIYDEENKLVLKETQNDVKEMRKRYDLSKLAKGTYTVKIESESFAFSEEIEIGKAMNELDFETVIAPEADGNKVRVGFANAVGQVVVAIQNEAGKVVHTEYLDAQTANYLFNMDKLSSGTYTVAVTNNGNTYTENYTVK